MLPPLCRFSESTCMVLRVLQIPASRLRVLSPAPLPPAAHLRAPRETGTPNELFIVPLRHGRRPIKFTFLSPCERHKINISACLG